MITCKNVCFSYCSNREDTDVSQNDGTLKNISCSIEDGSFVLLCGASGCGKTTLTRLFNGLIPHYYEGELSGQVLLDGKAYKDLSLFEISEKVGSVFQNPRSQFFSLDTDSEIVFGMENKGMPYQVRACLWPGKSRSAGMGYTKPDTAGSKAVKSHWAIGSKYIFFIWRGKTENRLRFCGCY